MKYKKRNIEAGFGAEYSREYRKILKEENAQKLSEEDRKKFEKHYVTIKGRATVMLHNARKRAKNNGVECTITKQWIIDKLSAGVCEVTGIPFKLVINGGRGHNNNSFAPSIDRIDQKGNYTPENCKVTSWIYNRARGAFPQEDFDLMIESLKTKL